MYKILITLPNSIAGTLIMNGFKQGFEANGCVVKDKDLRELSIDYIEKFNPDIIFGYDYGYLFSDDNDLREYIETKRLKKELELIHYFADDPLSRYALVGKDWMYKRFLELKLIGYSWDRSYTRLLNEGKYLPLAVNAKAYKLLPEQEQEYPLYPISFVGRPLTDYRQEILAAMIKGFGGLVNIFSYEKHFLQSIEDMKKKNLLNARELETYKNAYKGFLTTEQELAQVYNSSVVNLNITLQGEESLNYRVFEVLASKGFLLTDDRLDIADNFEEGRDLEIYSTVYDLADKTEFYLKHPDYARCIGEQGRGTVVKKHTYTERAKKILDDTKARRHNSSMQKSGSVD